MGNDIKIAEEIIYVCRTLDLLENLYKTVSLLESRYSDWGDGKKYKFFRHTNSSPPTTSVTCNGNSAL